MGESQIISGATQGWCLATEIVRTDDELPIKNESKQKIFKYTNIQSSFLGAETNTGMILLYRPIDYTSSVFISGHQEIL